MKSINFLGRRCSGSALLFPSAPLNFLAAPFSMRPSVRMASTARCNAELEIDNAAIKEYLNGQIDGSAHFFDSERTHLSRPCEKEFAEDVELMRQSRERFKIYSRIEHLLD